jgi:hypothetical protein
MSICFYYVNNPRIKYKYDWRQAIRYEINMPIDERNNAQNTKRTDFSHNDFNNAINNDIIRIETENCDDAEMPGGGRCRRRTFRRRRSRRRRSRRRRSRRRRSRRKSI